jgi:hypothetical protein
MTPRTLAATLFLLPCLLCVRPSPASEQPDKTKQPPAQKPNVASIERGLAEMEAKLLQMTKDVQALRGELKAMAPVREKPPSFHIFTLKHANAVQLANTLADFLDGKIYRIVSDPRTNSLLVQCDLEHSEVMEAIISRLDMPVEKRVPAEKQGVEEQKPR